MYSSLTIRGRMVATALATAALLLGGAAAAGGASAQMLDGGLFGSAPAHVQSTPGAGGAGGTLLGGQGLSGLGLFKALFAIFGAVRAQVPTIAGPIIAQGVADGTITPAEGDHLSALLAGHLARPGPGSGATGAPATKPSAGEIAVLRKVFAAVIGQIATIAAPVLVQEVAAKDITQAEADTITKILTSISAGKSPGSTSPGTSTTGAGLAASAASGNLIAPVEAKVVAKVKKSAKKHHKHKKATATSGHR